MSTQTPLAERYAELAEIAAQACAGGLLGRGMAQRYAFCRQQLLQDGNGTSVPGFVVQCVSIDRFVEFITLFHPEIDARRSFLTRQFSEHRAATMTAARTDIFAAPTEEICAPKGRSTASQIDIFDASW